MARCPEARVSRHCRANRRPVESSLPRLCRYRGWRITSFASSVSGTAPLSSGQVCTAAKSPRMRRCSLRRWHSCVHTSSGCSRSRSAKSWAVRVHVRGLLVLGGRRQVHAPPVALGGDGHQAGADPPGLTLDSDVCQRNGRAAADADSPGAPDRPVGLLCRRVRDVVPDAERDATVLHVRDDVRLLAFLLFQPPGPDERRRGPAGAAPRCRCSPTPQGARSGRTTAASQPPAPARSGTGPGGRTGRQRAAQRAQREPQRSADEPTSGGLAAACRLFGPSLVEQRG